MQTVSTIKTDSKRNFLVHGYWLWDMRHC